MDSTQPSKKNTQPTQVSATVCANCSTTTTPLWRRAPNGDTICNACGLYLKARNTLRPPSMKRNFKKLQQPPPLSQPAMGTCPGNGQCNGTGGSPSCEGCPAFNQHQVNRHTALICANCRTTTTPLWRRDEAGNTICNACGLYYKLHNVHRPVSMKRSVIKRRKRIIVAGDDHHPQEEEEEDDELDSSNEEEDIRKRTLSPTSDNPSDDDEEKAKQRKEQKQFHDPPNTHHFVPPIEDYIVPKRLTAFQAFNRRSQSENATSSHTLQRLPPPPRTPPLFPQHKPLPSLTKTNRFDPLYHYRKTSPSPSLLPPPVDYRPRLPSVPQNPYQDLQEFDHAMTRLERLRRRVSPEQGALLSKLTGSLEEITQQAEHILSFQSSMPLQETTLTSSP
ncbi:hypothetical protein BD560DRAFT_380739 [Blakeslea trispora]|nr:hypothetical protein BD560DRAFT_380739 [Blakeslea trispora]